MAQATLICGHPRSGTWLLWRAIRFLQGDAYRSYQDHLGFTERKGVDGDMDHIEWHDSWKMRIPSKGVEFMDVDPAEFFAHSSLARTHILADSVEAEQLLGLVEHGIYITRNGRDVVDSMAAQMQDIDPRKDGKCPVYRLALSWRRHLNMSLLRWQRVGYEELVRRPVDETQRLSEMLGLSWNPEVVDHISVAACRAHHPKKVRLARVDAHKDWWTDEHESEYQRAMDG